MDWIKMKKTLRETVIKYKYPLIVLCLGVLLLILPVKNNKSNVEHQQVIIEKSQSILDVEDRLSSILSAVAGAGDVKVLLTLSRGEEILYQTNLQNSAGSGNVREDTVTVTDSERNEQGLVRQTIPAVYKGAVIVCEGADDPSVRLAIVNAVSNATGLGADKITVLKMK